MLYAQAVNHSIVRDFRAFNVLDRQFLEGL